MTLYERLFSFVDLLNFSYNSTSWSAKVIQASTESSRLSIGFISFAWIRGQNRYQPAIVESKWLADTISLHKMSELMHSSEARHQGKGIRYSIVPRGSRTNITIFTFDSGSVNNGSENSTGNLTKFIIWIGKTRQNPLRNSQFLHNDGTIAQIFLNLVFVFRDECLRYLASPV